MDSHPTLRVLQIQDSVEATSLVQRHLEAAGRAVHSRRLETAAELSAAIASAAWDIIIASGSSSRFGAAEAMALLRDGGHDIPLIVLSDDDDEEHAVDLLRAGARDCLGKRQLARLAPVVTRECQGAQCRARARQAEAELCRMRESGRAGTGSPEAGENRTRVSGIGIAWQPERGTCTFEELPVAMMWVDTTLAGLMAGVQAMVGTARFGLALQGEGRKSVEADWVVISGHADFRKGFEAISNFAAVAGWGEWRMAELNLEQRRARFRVRHGWESRYQKALGVCWGSSMLAGKFAGYCSKLFETPCWAEQTAFASRGDEYDEFEVAPSRRSLEAEIDGLLQTDAATRADLAAAWQKLQVETRERVRAEARLRQAVAAGNVGLWDWDLATDKVTYSREWKLQVGCREDEIGDGFADWRDRVHPDDLGPALERIRDFRDGRTERYESEFRLRHKDGTYRWILARGSIIPGDPDGGQHMVGSHVDITDRRREAKLVQIQLDLATALGAARNREEGMRLCVQTAMKATGLDSGGFFLVNRDSGGLDFFVPCGLSPEFVRSVSHYDADSDRARLVMAGQPIYSRYDEMGLEMPAGKRREGIRFLAVVPVRVEDRVIGSLNIGSHVHDDIQPIQRKILETIAAAAGQALLRIEAEEALRANEVRYRALFEDAVDGILLLSADGRILGVNTAFVRMHGYEHPAEMMSLSMEEIDTPEARVHLPDRVRRVAAGETLQFETEHFRKDGSRFPLSVTSRRVDIGGTSYLQAFHRDITERRQFERDLRESRDGLLEAQSLARLGSWRLDLVHDRLEWSPEIFRIFEIDPTRFGASYEAFLSAIHPDDRGRVDEAYRASVRDRTIYAIRHRLLLQDGRVKHVFERGRTDYDGDGRPLRSVGTVQEITEQVLAEAALMESEERFRSLVEHSLDSLLVVDAADGRLLSVNPAAVKLFGARDEAELVRCTPWQLSPEVQPDGTDSAAAARARIAKAIQDGFHEFDWTHRGLDGRTFLAQIQLAAVRRGGELVLQAAVRDITERRRSEQALLESERRLRNLILNLDAGVVLHDAETRIVLHNRRAEEILGLTDEQMSGRAATDPLWHLVRADGSRLPLEEYPVVQVLGRRSALRDLELGACKPDGSRAWTLVNAFPEFGDGGEVRQVVVTFVDITARRRAEERLRESELKHRIVADNTFDWEFWIGPDGRFIYSSPSCERITGYPPSRFEEDPGLMERIIHPADRQRYQAHHGVAMRTKQEPEQEFRIVRADGTERWIGHACAPIHDADGRFLGIRGSNRDISQRKRAVEEQGRVHLLLRQVGRMAKVGGWEFEVPSGDGHWTEEVERIHDLEPGTPTCKALGLSFFQGEHRSRIEAALEMAIILGTPYDLELELVSAKGVRKWVRTIGEAVREGGRTVRLRGAFQDISERKRAESALIEGHKSRERLLLFNEALVSSMPAAVFYKDSEGRYLGCNRRFSEILGVSPEEIRGKTVDQLWPADLARLFHQRDLELMAHPGEQVYEHRVLGGDGVERPAIFAKNVFYDEAGRVAGIIGAFLDISERKRVEEALALEVARRRVLVESSRDGIVVLDQDGKVFEANRRFSEMLGYGGEEVLGLHVWDWDRDWPPERVFEAIRSIGPDGMRIETRHWRKDGTWLDVEMSNSAVELGGQRLVFCVCRDVTDRKRMDALLQESLLFRREAEKIARVGAWKVNPEIDYLYWTEGVYEILEAPLDYRPGLREGLRFYDEESIPHLQAALERALADGTPFALEVGLTTMKGRHLWTEVRGLGRMEEGGNAFVMGTFQDITEQKLAREELLTRERIFSNIVAQAQDAITVIDAATGRFVEFNAAAHEGLGYSRAEFAGFDITHIQGEHSPEVIQANLEVIHREGHLRLDTRHRHRDGSLRDVRVSVRRLDLAGKDYLAAVWTDVTELKRAETRARRESLRTEFLLELHRRALQMTDDELFQHVLDRAVAMTDSKVGFFHQVSEDQNTILLTAWNAVALAQCNADFDRHYPVAKAGNWVDCIREQRPIVFNDYAHSPNQRGLPAGHVPLRRFMSVPVVQGGRVRIIFGVGNRPEDYTADDVTQLQLVANELHKIMIQRAAEGRLHQLSTDDGP